MPTLTAYATGYTLNNSLIVNGNNPLNAGVSNYSYATCKRDSDYSSSVIFYGFNFSSIPTGSTITSIVAKIKVEQFGSQYCQVTFSINNGYNGSSGTMGGSGAETIQQSLSASLADLKANANNNSIEVDTFLLYSEWTYVYGMQIEVTYTVPTYNISASAGSNGSISPNGTVSVSRGSNQTFTITPNTGYLLDVLTVDGSTANPTTTTPSITYVFTNVTTTHSISVTFKLGYDLKKLFHEQLNEQLFGGI